MTDQDNERVRGLREHIARQYEGTHISPTTAIAQGILNDPATHFRAMLKAGVPIQALLDVAVEEGALEWDDDGPTRAFYVLPRPKLHVHEPYVVGLREGYVRLVCGGCDEEPEVPWSLPIEWPEETGPQRKVIE
jgi:hypothetical protein